MSFNYERNKNSHSGDGFWTSYSDLFLGLSTIFLLLYVTASLRSGTDAIKGQVDNQKLTMKVQELESQLKMYEQVKKDYLEKQASKDETQEYVELMDKLTLLREEAKSEKERLAQQALENEGKAQALNKYQQLVRNIINANKVAKTKIIARNDIIGDQDTTIDQQQKDIGQLTTDVEAKKQMIADNEKKIAAAQKAAATAKKKLLSSYKANQITKNQFMAKTKELESKNQKQLAGLKSANLAYSKQLNEMSSELKGTQAKAEAAEGKAHVLESKTQELQGALAKAKEEADARRGIAKEIQKGFKAAGIKAEVDGQTGEVVIDFGENYFDSDSSKLKPKMKEIIEQAIPIYSKSLFGNAKVANKISTVEIIGFASPTYQGRFIDPKSSKPEDKAALKYNMDLSYQRANSIFGYLLETKNSDQPEEKNLISLMKVSGRSFLDVMKVQTRGPASAAEFCKKNDCKKAQRVIVRFSMDGKTAEKGK